MPEEVQDRAYFDITLTLCDKNNIEDALRAGKKVRSDSDRWLVLEKIARILITKKRFDQAKEVVILIEDPSVKSSLLRSLNLL